MSNDRLKFRAWHRGNKAFDPAMIYPEDGCQGQVFKWLESGQPVEIMQWTGLYDSEGVEIYSGDITKESKYGVNYLVRYIVDGYCLDAGETPRLHDYICENGNVTVIGNIYENPELLDA